MNVVLQAMSHVDGVRNYFLDENNYNKIKRKPGDLSFELVTRFGELIRKLWNTKNFKAHVSPHEMLQVSPKIFVHFFSHFSFRRLFCVPRRNSRSPSRAMRESFYPGFSTPSI